MATRKTNMMSILALVFGIIFAPLGLLFGIIALNQLKANPKEVGKGMAIAGLLFSILSVLFWIWAFNLPEETIQEEYAFEEHIFWISYEYEAKTADGTQFSSGAKGSGVAYEYVNDTLTVFTNRHVIDCLYTQECFQKLSETITARAPDGELFTVEQVSYAPHDLDVAMLEFKSENDYSVQAIASVEAGAPVIAVGYPGFIDRVSALSITEGQVTELKKFVMSDGFGFDGIRSDAYIDHGSSGGGMFTPDGALIGITTWAANDEDYSNSFAIHIDSLLNAGTYQYCDEGSYYTNDGCLPFCNSDEVQDSSGECYTACEDYYCLSEHFLQADSRCSGAKILGQDGVCHDTCGSPTTYCPDANYCFKDECVSCPLGMQLYLNGQCKK